MRHLDAGPIEQYQRVELRRIPMLLSLHGLRLSDQGRMLWLMELSIAEPPWGVIRYADDDIARHLKMHPGDWLDLRDRLCRSGLMRQIAEPGHTPRYEISPALMPRQPDGCEGRDLSAWRTWDPAGAPAMVDTVRREPGSHEPWYGGRPSSGRERTARCRWRAQFLAEHGRDALDSEMEEWTARYRECNASRACNGSVTAVRPQTTIQTENQSSSSAEARADDDDSAASPAPETTLPLNSLIQAGLPERQAQKLLKEHGPEHCLHQLTWLPHRGEMPEGVTPQARLVTAIREHWAPPYGYAEQVRREEEAAARLQEVLARSVEREREEEVLTAAIEALSPEECDELRQQALARLPANVTGTQTGARMVVGMMRRLVRERLAARGDFGGLETPAAPGRERTSGSAGP